MPIIERRQVPASTESIDWPSTTHPVLRQVLCRRSLGSLAELELGLGNLTPVGSFDALAGGVECLLAHREGRIVIVGDFDSDGATSSALMLLVLRDLGFDEVSFFIPDRFELGYGLTPGVIEKIADRKPTLIVTVDNGISSVEGVAAARSAGIDVLITDHHLPPEVLPDANVMINPNLPGDEFSGKNLAGVGVVFYLMAALARDLGEPARVAEFLDLVALGTVADLVSLDQTNRVLVQQGLRRIQAGRCRPGILALCEVAGVDHRSVASATLGYQLAPRLNAAGRLDDMSIGVRCLISEHLDEARELASRLDALNRERRSLEARMRAEAMELLGSEDLVDSENVDHVVCLYRDDWHEGLVGLIASRVKERYFRPVFAFAPSGDDELKGSGRSIPGFHLRDALALVDSERPGLIRRFGGHAMAAGLSLSRANLEAFHEAIEAVGAGQLTEEQLEQKIMSDGEIASEHMVVEVARMLRDAAPWGQGFPEPLFDGIFELLDVRWLKQVHLKMSLRSVSGGPSLDAIAFNCMHRDVHSGQRIRAAYRLSINDFYAQPRVQLLVEHIDTPIDA